MSKNLKHKTFKISTEMLITAVMTALAVYAGIHINTTNPESMLALAVPVGMSTAQQMLLTVWSEFSGRLEKTCTA